MFPAADRKSTPEEEAAFRAAVDQPAAQRLAGKQAALEACSGEEAALLQCYRGGSFFGCAAARTAFWDCYKKHRVRHWQTCCKQGCAVTRLRRAALSYLTRCWSLSRQGFGKTVLDMPLGKTAASSSAAQARAGHKQSDG